MEMDDKVVDMRFVLNSIIGSSLCTDRTSEKVQVVKTSGLMSFDGGQVSRYNYHIFYWSVVSIGIHMGEDLISVRG